MGGFVRRTNHNRAGELNLPSNFPIYPTPDAGFPDSSPQQPLRGRRDQEDGFFSAAGGPRGEQSAAAGVGRAPSCLPAGRVWGPGCWAPAPAAREPQPTARGPGVPLGAGVNISGARGLGRRPFVGDGQSHRLALPRAVAPASLPRAG